MDRKKFLTQSLREVTPWSHVTQRPHSMTVCIGDIPLQILTREDFVYQTLLTYFQAYLSTDLPTAYLRIETLFSATYPNLWEEEDPEFQIQGSTVIHRDFAAKKFSSHDVGKIPTATAWINPQEPYDAIHNLLRWFLPSLLLEKQSFLVHGAGVVKNGWGYAFFGQSGAGKSTCTQLISAADAETTLVGDDAIILRYDSATRQTWLTSAPLGNGYSRLAPPRIQVPLHGLYSLHQDQTFFIEKLHPTTGLQSLLASAMSVQFTDQALERIELSRLISFSLCGIQRLHFKKDAQFWAQIQKGEPHGQSPIHSIPETQSEVQKTNHHDRKPHSRGSRL